MFETTENLTEKDLNELQLKYNGVGLNYLEKGYKNEVFYQLLENEENYKKLFGKINELEINRIVDSLLDDDIINERLWEVITTGLDELIKEKGL